MLKGFVSGEEKDIKRIPMGTRNLISVQSFTIQANDGSKRTNLYTGTLPLGVYTLSLMQDDDISGSTRNALVVRKNTVSYASEDTVDNYHNTKGIHRLTFTVDDNTANFELQMWAHTLSNECTYSNIMLNLGSTPLPYEPYGYQEGWEVRDSQDRLIWGREDELQTATGTLPFKGYALPVKVKSLLGNAVQNGTPSPDPANPNLADPSKTVPGYQESNGSIHVPSAAEEITTDFIPFTSTLYILISGSANGDMNYAAYNANKQIIGIYNTGFTPNTVITANPQSYTGAAYLRASWTHGVNQPICITTKQTATFIPFDPNPPGPVIPEMCGVRTGNLLDFNALANAPSGVMGLTCPHLLSLKLKPNTKYTLISNGSGSTINTPAELYRSVYFNSTESESSVNKDNPVTVDVPSTGIAQVGFFSERTNAQQYLDGTAQLWLVEGEVATTPYEPYGWKVLFENHGENLCPVSQWTNDQTDTRYPFQAHLGAPGVASVYKNISSEGRYSLTITGFTSGRITFKHNGASKDLYIYRNEYSFDEPVSITVSFYVEKYDPREVGGIVVSDIMLNLGSTPKPYSPYLNATIPVCLGEVPTVRRVRKVVLTGEEEWTEVYPGEPEAQAQGIVMYSTSLSEIGTDRNDFICSHFFVGNYRGYLISGQGRINGTSPETFNVNYNNGSGGLQNFKTWLADEYAAGHPVTLWYALATEQTSVVNEPLCKISTYADELTTIQVHGLSAPLYGIGSYKDTLNLSTGVVTRKVKKLVLTGQEQVGGSRTNGYSISATGSENAPTYCTHFAFQNVSSWDELQDGCVSNSISRYFRIKYTDCEDTTAFKAYLAQQYANGTPVTVWYVLSTPETETVTVPTGMTGEIEGYLTQISTPSPTKRSVPKWNGEEESGGTYAVTVYTPPEIPTTTGENTLTVDSNLAPSKLEVSIHAKKIHYGFKIDKSNDNSESAVIYTHDAVTMTPAHMDFTNDRFDYGSWGNAFFVRDCYPVALNLDGTIAYRLDPDDYTKKTDGTPSDIFYELLTAAPSDWSTQWKQYYTKDANDNYELNSQGSAPTFTQDTYYKLTYSSSFTGNFMMAFPKVWFYRHEDSQYNYIEISNYKLSDDWKCYAHINASGQEVDFIYLPLFKGVIKSSKLRSLPGQIPQGNTTATDEANAATALGSRWQIWDHSSVELINDLLTLMSKSIDSKGRFGQGRSSGYDSTDTVTYGKLQTGTLIKGGKFHGYSATTKEVKVFGIEGFWANRFDRLQGMLLVNNVWKIKMTPPYNFTGTDFVTLSTAEVPSGTGFLSRVQTSEYGSIPASIANGSGTKYFKDPFFKSATNTRVALRGGSCTDGGNAGFRYINVDSAASVSYWPIGASPVYK